MPELVATLLDHKASRESWAVARLRVIEAPEGSGARRQQVVTAVGPRLGLAAPGEDLRLVGEWDESPYGLQFKVDSQASLGVRSSATAHRWLERLDGVGPVMARRIYERFGEGVIEVLRTPPGQGCPDPLMGVRGISATLAATIRESWDELQAAGSPEDLAYLEGELGLTRWETNNVLRHAQKLRMTPRDLLEGNPYRLMEVRGFGFKRADVVARKAGCPAHAPARLEAAAVHAVSEACEDDTMIPLGRLVSETSDLTGVEGGPILDAICRLAANDKLIVQKDERGVRWAHPVPLYQAERTAWRLTRGARA